jgi:hypothetical protein
MPLIRQLLYDFYSIQLFPALFGVLLLSLVLLFLYVVITVIIDIS